ncbi:Aspartate/methionine/tyrosine aminotransferase [Desulfocicer vacuolatum DSM 3385]|uniref:Aspartate/methionine/tyrosine aminotransferase n=1 Tax=Desulfocicer vacuolatum DSM 3385 TaxID=1121400 RepID=A0A1W1ZN54_9BACT|nr:aminotransferase class I/II-fold pyridoxal phosphate-dependent enzyme [Desulfocicer vacuolatum]SMC49538.1 Aspartate/methionine/tyrosine aminotransferase [Desulfocicer vacuolatum DSM 3385]
MNVLAEESNAVIKQLNPYVYDMLSRMGKELFFPRGILTQSAEAKQKAHKINATIGIAKEKGKVMSLSSITSPVGGLEPDAFLPYAPSFGLPTLREQWQKSLFEKNSSLEGKCVSLPVVTSGITHAVSTFADMWMDPGDVVILPDMMWGNYNMTFGVRNQARVVTYNTFNADLTGLDIEAFEKAVRDRAATGKKIITILNFPNNPSGYSPTVAEAEKITAILVDIAQKGSNVVVGCDDAYFGLFFEEETMKESIFSLLAGSHERIAAVKLDGATKEDYVWGLRTGFVTYGFCASQASQDLGPLYAAMEQKTAGCIRGNSSNVSHLSQSILLKGMEAAGYGDEKKEKFDILKSRAQAIKSVLKDPVYRDAWDVYPFNSGYFMCVRLKDVDAETLRLHLLDTYGVGLIAIGQRNIRVAFSCMEEDEVKVLFDILLKGIKDLK